MVVQHDSMLFYVNFPWDFSNSNEVIDKLLRILVYCSHTINFYEYVKRTCRGKACGCYSVHFPCSPTSTKHIYTKKELVLQQKIYDVVNNSQSSNANFTWCSYDYLKYMFVDSLTKYIGSPNCVHQLSFLKTRVLILCVLWSSPNHAPIQYKCMIWKKNWITPAYLVLIVTHTHNTTHTYGFIRLDVTWAYMDFQSWNFLGDPQWSQKIKWNATNLVIIIIINS